MILSEETFGFKAHNAKPDPEFSGPGFALIRVFLVLRIVEFILLFLLFSVRLFLLILTVCLFLVIFLILRIVESVIFHTGKLLSVLSFRARKIEIVSAQTVKTIRKEVLSEYERTIKKYKKRH